MPVEPPAPVTDLDWSPQRARQFANHIVDLYAAFLATLPDGPASPHVTPASARAAVTFDVPELPLGDEVIAGRLQALLDNSTRPGSGGFLAYISGAGTVPGAIVDLLASGLNANVGGWAISPAASEVERQLVDWFAERFGYPPGAGGMLVQGGSLANLTGLKLARDHAWPPGRQDGLIGGPRLAFYTSAEAHFTIDRAADVLGLGEGAVRHVPVDADLRMRVDELERLIAADEAAGIRPAGIAATAGTTGTGAIDPLSEIAAVASRHGAWFHVDAAYGGALAVSDDLRPLLTGIELADSITFDAHKWLYAPVASAFILVRDASTLGGSFSAHAAYVEQERDVIERGPDMGFEGLQLTRGFAALRVWVALLAHGRAAFAKRIEHDVELTRWLAQRVEETPDLELACRPTLSICCFRYRPDGVDDEEYLDRLNMRIMTAIQADGTVFPSNAVVHGRTAIRSCIVTYRTEAAHLQRLLDIAREIGARLHESGEVAP
ncbi:MAG: pyridoxal phosphate-dependent decarboxylase family protein [Acidimicrobiales bacterium]